MSTGTFTRAMRSCLETSLRRYARSKGLWILLLAGLVGARFWLPRDDGNSVVISVNGHLPVLTSPMIGLSLATVFSTILLPFCFLYLRSNVTRRQPWQVAEVTPASRVAMSLGSFLADCAVLLLLLCVLALAGWLMAWFVLPVGEIHCWQLVLALGAASVPAAMGVAALRSLAGAFRLTRRAFGDVLFFACWMFSVLAPMFAHAGANTFGADLLDLGGAIQPLSSVAGGLRSLNIGYGMAVLPGRVSLDVLPMFLSGSYLSARVMIAFAAVVLAVLAGVLYQPQILHSNAARARRWTRWMAPGPAPGAEVQLVSAGASRFAMVSLIGNEMRLIGGSRPRLLCAVVVALIGGFANFRHVTSPLFFLLLIFGLTAEAAREETKGVLALTTTMPLSPWHRRAAFVTAGLLVALCISLPSLMIHPSVATLGLAAAIGFGAALFTMAATVLSRSAFAARLLLLLVWYGYISAT